MSSFFCSAAQAPGNPSQPTSVVLLRVLVRITEAQLGSEMWLIAAGCSGD